MGIFSDVVKNTSSSRKRGTNLRPSRGYGAETIKRAT
jgi:hypothetical protein